MFVKAIATFVLLGFFCVQLGSTLDCYSCNGPTACRSPGKITCNADHANATTAHLHYYYTQNLTSSTSTNYDCFHHNYTSIPTNVTYKGCVYREINPCALTFKTEFQGLQRKDCGKCSGNLCNPAATFSSSVLTMLTSVFVVSIFKVWKM